MDYVIEETCNHCAKETSENFTLSDFTMIIHKISGKMKKKTKKTPQTPKTDFLHSQKETL